MNATQRETYLLHATLPRHRRRVEQSLRIIEDCFARTASPYIAFSAGKDSSVLLHLVRSVAPDTPAVWSDDEWHYPETLDLVARTPNCTRIAAQVQHASWFRSWARGAPLPEGTLWVDAPKNDGLQTHAAASGYDGVFIGLRADENGRRRTHLRVHGLLFFALNYQVWQCNPIGWWTIEDVWAYLLAHDVPYNAAYDRMFDLGIAPERQRVGPFAVERALGYGQLTILRRGWPELYARFVAEYPEAAGYT